jgi:hypothetical protein
MGTPTFYGFISGLLVSIGARGLYQDYLGLEEYVAGVIVRWVDASISVPMGLVVLIFGILVYQMGIEKQKEIK